MKFTIKKNIILEALSNAVKALSTKITIPVLNGILFKLTESSLEIQASDSELTIKTTIDNKDIINVEQVGSAVLQSRCLIDIIRKMPNDIINFELTTCFGEFLACSIKSVITNLNAIESVYVDPLPEMFVVITNQSDNNAVGSIVTLLTE